MICLNIKKTTRAREVFTKLLAMMNEEKKHVNCIFDTSMEKGNVIFEIIDRLYN